MEEPIKETRRPKQKRSLETQAKILDAAYGLFCEKGYFKTTTNEIAKVAGVNIGSLYAYFKDKDTILTEIIRRFDDAFFGVLEEVSQNIELCRSDMRAWLLTLMEGLIRARRVSADFNRELRTLYFSVPEVAAVMDRQQESMRKMVVDYFERHRAIIRTPDLEAAALVSFALVQSMVDQIVFEQNALEQDRLLEAAVDALHRYLIANAQ